MLRIVPIVWVLIAASATAWSAEETSLSPATLHNGIPVPYPWPRAGSFTSEPPVPACVLFPPRSISIGAGRQLFVDDFLVEQTNLKRTYHTPEYVPNNPVLSDGMVFSDGVWFDPKDNFFKMWYLQGRRNTACVFSRDGIHWEKPAQVGTQAGNSVYEQPRDSAIIWLDMEDKNPAQRFKMFRTAGLCTGEWGFELNVSPDGLQWSAPVARTIGGIGDRVSAFRNPFRNAWVYSLRGNGVHGGRVRYCFEHADFLQGACFKAGEPVAWTCVDRMERVRLGKSQHDSPSLYNLDCVAYESVLLGLFTLLRGWSSPGEPSRPKINEVTLGFSRDGIQWYRPQRNAFLPVSEDPKAWNWGNVQSAGGGCLVVGDKLYFYASGRNAAKETTGLATLRRDGFASMDASDKAGSLTTRLVAFNGKHLFVNANFREGELRIEVLDKDGKAIPSFTTDDCIAVKTDSTIQPIQWKGGGDLSVLAGQAVKFRFHLSKGKLYAFWVSPDKSGASHGYVAAGGPGFTGATDTVGMAALEAGKKLQDLGNTAK